MFDLEKYKRELLFRGLCTDSYTGWVYGNIAFYRPNNEYAGMYLQDFSGLHPKDYLVKANTIGQYTGYKEFVFSDQTKQREIFEHDIVEIWAERTLNGDKVTKYDTYVKIRGVVVFYRGYWKIDFDNNYNNKICQPKGGERIWRQLDHWSELDDYGWGVFKNQEYLEWYLKREANHPLNYLHDITIVGNIHDNLELLD